MNLGQLCDHFNQQNAEAVTAVPSKSRRFGVHVIEDCYVAPGSLTDTQHGWKPQRQRQALWLLLEGIPLTLALTCHLITVSVSLIGQITGGI